MKVKICGLRRIEDIDVVNEVMPDFVGFVFAPSSRRVSVDTAKHLIQHLNNDIKTVGVFVDPTLEELTSIQNDLHLDYIQLHGDESRDLALAFPGQIIKAFSSDSPLSIQEQIAYPSEYILIDSPRADYHGGSGKTFDWTPLAKEKLPQERLIIAGGLDADNVKTLYHTLHPAVVDVSSSVETDGYKDPDKIRDFVHAVRTLQTN